MKGLQVHKRLALISNSVSGTNTDTPVQQRRAAKAAARQKPQKLVMNLEPGRLTDSGDGTIAQRRRGSGSVFQQCVNKASDGGVET